MLGAVRSLKSLLDTGTDRAVALKEGHKELLFAAELLAGILPLALLGRAEQALRTGGLSGRQLRALLEGMEQRMLLDAAHSSHSARSPLRQCPPSVAKQHLGALTRRHPDLAKLVRQQAGSDSVTGVFERICKTRRR